MNKSEIAENEPLLLFDGICNLCNQSVQWVLLRDKKGVFHFTSLQSDYGQAVLLAYQIPTDQTDTVVLIDKGKAYFRSDVPLRVWKQMGWPWSWMAVFAIVPHFIRDAVYNWVARNRYKWFGKTDACMLPRAEWKHRFV